MRHYKVDWKTDLRDGDYVIYKGRWCEIYKITEENGIFISWGGNICRTELEKESEIPVLAFDI